MQVDMRHEEGYDTTPSYATLITTDSTAEYEIIKAGIEKIQQEIKEYYVKHTKRPQRYKVIALMGKSGSGKDTILRAALEQFPELFHEVISCTTRPPRDYEEYGKDYYFLTPVEFADAIYGGEMIEATVFNDWGYGTKLDALKLDKINLGVWNPEGVQLLLEDSRVEVVIIEIQAEDKVRLMRSLEREKDADCVEICRRFSADQADFLNAPTSDFTFINNEITDLSANVDFLGGLAREFANL